MNWDSLANNKVSFKKGLFVLIFKNKNMMSIKLNKKVVEIPVEYLPRKGNSKITGSMFKALKLGLVMIFYIIFRRLSFKW